MATKTGLEIPVERADEITMVHLRQFKLDVPVAKKDDEFHVPVRALCAYMKVAPEMQTKRIREHPTLARRLRRFWMPTVKGERPTYTLAMKAIGFWLGTMSAAYVREELHAGLLDFQEQLLEAANELLERGARSGSLGSARAIIPVQRNDVEAVARFSLALEERIGRLEEAVFVDEAEEEIDE